MVRFRVVLCCGLFAVCAWDAAVAQQAGLKEKMPTEKEIVQLLNSDDPREMAWGAHYAKIKQSAAANAALFAVAERWQPIDRSERPYVKLTQEQGDQEAAMAAALDAIVQLHINLSTEVLDKLASEFPNYVAVLMTRMPIDQVRQLGFDFFRQMPEQGWSLQYVSAALLVKSPPTGFAAELLAGVHVSADISIVLPGSSGLGRGMSFGDCGPGWGDRENWPKFGNYQFSHEKGEQATLLLEEPQPVYVMREESTQDPGSRCPGLVLQPEDRRRFLAYMLKIKPEEIGWKTNVYETIVYQSPQQVDLEVRKLIAKEQEMFRTTAQQLIAKGLMEESEADSIPLLKLHWWLNFESENAPNIPKPTVLPKHVEWSEIPWD